MEERIIKDINDLLTQLFQKMKEAGYEWDAAKKELKKIEQKSYWSKVVQEEQVNEKFIKALGTMLNDGLPDRYLVSEERIKKSAELLFSIARKQLKNEIQEWSEEDEKMLDKMRDYFMRFLGDKPDFTDDKRYEGFVEFIDHRLKSIRPQSQWKPNNEHYELEEFAKIVRGNLIGISKAVQELFEAKYLQLTGNKMYGGFKD